MENERNTNYRSSGSRIYRPHKESKFTIYGIRPILEAIEKGEELESVFIQKGTGGNLMNELIDKLHKNQIAYQLVPVEKLNRITQKVHQGVVAFMAQITYHPLDILIPELFEKGETPLLMLLDRITDVRNFGAIARSCECLGVHGLIIPSKGNALINEDAIKTSAGALLSIPVCREPQLSHALQFLRNSGISIISCTEKASDPLESISYSQPACIVLGSEEDGIADAILRLSDHLVRIPMIGTIGSLNVSVSAGIILSEAQRQRRI